MRTPTARVQAMYRATGRVRCANLVRLRSNVEVEDEDERRADVEVERDRTTVRLHLEPLGQPLGQHSRHDIQSEADLRLAVSGVLTGMSALHEAGEVIG